MKTYITSLFVVASLAFFSAPLMADDVCGDLVDGTPGLYGLCNAYCVAQECDSYAGGEAPNSCNRLLANYNKKRNDSDPEMPCAAVSCPCWGMDELTAGGSGLANQGNCSTGGTQVASWFEGTDSITFIANENPNTGDTTCGYANSLTGVVNMNVPTNEEQDAECRAGITALQEDFTVCF